MCSEIISIPKRKWTLFQFRLQGLPLKTKSNRHSSAPNKGRVTEEPTMGSIDGLNKDTTVWWCATQLSSQVGWDNGTIAACPCKTCDVAGDIRGWRWTKRKTHWRNIQKLRPQPGQQTKMRFVAPLFVFLAVAAFQSGEQKVFRRISVTFILNVLLFINGGHSLMQNCCPLFILVWWIVMICSSLSISELCRERGGSCSERWGTINGK